jgi:hypothetical protein
MIPRTIVIENKEFKINLLVVKVVTQKLNCIWNSVEIIPVMRKTFCQLGL